MGNQNDREGIGLEVALQPVARLDVQVVGRLVEQQDVRFGEKQPGQGDPHLPAAGELAAFTLPVRGEKTQAAQDIAHLRFHGIATLEAEFLLKMAEPLQKAARVRGIVRYRLEKAGQILHFPFDLLQF